MKRQCMHIYLHILNLSCQIQSICQMFNSSYTFRHEVIQSTRFWSPFLPSKLNSHQIVPVYLLTFCIYRTPADPTCQPATHDEPILHFSPYVNQSHRVNGYPVLESSIPFSRERSCFASELVTKLKSRTPETNWLILKI